METIDLVANVNNLFKAIAGIREIEKITEDICPHCLVEMQEIDRDVDVKYYPISGPEITRVNRVKYRCPECGEEFTVYNNQ